MFRGAVRFGVNGFLTVVLIVAAACYAAALIAIRWPKRDAVVHASLILEN